MKHHDVLHDPVFHVLMQRHARAARRLRDSVLALRSWHLHHTKHPGEQDIGEKWRSATLQDDVTKSLELVRDAAADLVLYGFEMAPHSDETEHLSEIAAARVAHKKRVEEKTGWGTRAPEAKGPEEQVKAADGPPVTIVLKSKPPEKI